MSDALTLSFELAAFGIAALLAVYAIWKLDIRPMLAGAALAASAWTLAGCISEPRQPYQRLGLITLRLRPIDALTGERLNGLTVDVIAPDDTGELASWRQPVTANHADKSLVDLSLIIEQEIQGSPWQQFWRPADCIGMNDQQIEFSAPGHQPWRGSLKELLGNRWPMAADEPPLNIELRSVE